MAGQGCVLIVYSSLAVFVLIFTTTSSLAGKITGKLHYRVEINPENVAKH